MPPRAAMNRSSRSPESAGRTSRASRFKGYAADLPAGQLAQASDFGDAALHSAFGAAFSDWSDFSDFSPLPVMAAEFRRCSR